MEGVRERYERLLGDVKELTRYLTDRINYMERINIINMETSSKTEGKILEIMEAQSNINTGESKMGKFRPE